MKNNIVFYWFENNQKWVSVNQLSTKWTMMHMCKDIFTKSFKTMKKWIIYHRVNEKNQMYGNSYSMVSIALNQTALKGHENTTNGYVWVIIKYIVTFCLVFLLS